LFLLNNTGETLSTTANTVTEVKEGGGDWSIHDFSPFTTQRYGVFAFLADVRNDFLLTPVAFHKGLPEGHESVEIVVSFYGHTEMRSRYPDAILEGHSKAYVYLRELLSFNYDQQFEDRRNYGHRGPDWKDSVAPGEGSLTTYRELLGPGFFEDLDVLKNIGEPDRVRVVLAFDS
jgi:hypothetical protein